MKQAQLCQALTQYSAWATVATDKLEFLQQMALQQEWIRARGERRTGGILRQHRDWPRSNPATPRFRQWQTFLLSQITIEDMQRGQHRISKRTNVDTFKRLFSFHLVFRKTSQETCSWKRWCLSDGKKAERHRIHKLSSDWENVWKKNCEMISAHLP